MHAINSCEARNLHAGSRQRGLGVAAFREAGG